MESSPNGSLRQCPTRRDGGELLIAQQLTLTMCHDRQRGYYHKCWSCVHRNGVASRPAPVLRITKPEGESAAEAV